jgi:hypothetical protein
LSGRIAPYPAIARCLGGFRVERDPVRMHVPDCRALNSEQFSQSMACQPNLKKDQCGADNCWAWGHLQTIRNRVRLDPDPVQRQ